MSNQPSHGFLTHPIRPGLCAGWQKPLGLLLLASLAFAFSLLLGACAEDGGAGAGAGAANQGQTNPIAGRYNDVFGNSGTYTITDTTWTREFSSQGRIMNDMLDIVEIDSGQQFLTFSKTHTMGDRFNPTICPNPQNSRQVTPSPSTPVTCYARTYWMYDVAGRLHICRPGGVAHTLRDAQSQGVDSFDEQGNGNSTPPRGCKDANDSWIRLFKL